jgi:hypothetical protein
MIRLESPEQTGERLALLKPLNSERICSFDYSDTPLELLLEAIYLADLHSYPTGYQVERPKLEAALRAFPQGFRLYAVQDPADLSWLPAGYSAFHPVASYQLQKPDLDLLAPVPLSATTPLYLFNYSVHSSLKRTILSRFLLSRLALDLSSFSKNPRCAATVSEDGERVARRFGLLPAQTLYRQGLPWVWWTDQNQNTMEACLL